MNIHKNIRDQKVLKRNTLINYTARYICFIESWNSIKNMDNNWEDQYIDKD